MIVARNRDPELAAAHRAFVAARRAEAAAVVRRGADRGEIRADTDADLLVDLVAGPIFYRVLVNDHSLDDHYVDGLVDAALLAFAP